MAMVDRVEKFSQIDVHDPVASQLHLLLPQRVQCSMSTASGAEPVRDVQKVRLVYRFQHHQHRTLKNFIFIRGYPQRASLVRRASLGDMHSTHGRRHVRAGFGAVEEVLEVGLQVDLVFFRGLSVHADGPVPACPSMGCEHPFDVDVMRQCREGHVRGIPGEFRDPLLFRGHEFGSRRTRHVSLQRFIRRRLLPSPGSLRDGSPGSAVLRDAPTPCRPSRRASFPSLGDTIVSSLVRPRSASDVGRGSTWSW